MEPRRYAIEAGRTLCVLIEMGAWTAWLVGGETRSVHGWPLEGVLAECFGLNPAHDELPREVTELARRIQQDFGPLARTVRGAPEPLD